MKFWPKRNVRKNRNWRPKNNSIKNPDYGFKKLRKEARKNGPKSTAAKLYKIVFRRRRTK